QTMNTWREKSGGGFWIPNAGGGAALLFDQIAPLTSCPIISAYSNLEGLAAKCV
ncbi:hypothetical protein BDP55DRAFT_674826, partial [Colletotrichum godetiae]